MLNPFNKLFGIEEADSKYTNFRLDLEDRNLMYMFSVFFLNFTDLFRYLEINWKQIVKDIEDGTVSDLGMIREDVKEKLLKKLKPNPKRAAELRAEFEKGFDETIIKRLWPNMSVMCGIGTSSFTPFTKIARRYTEGIPFDFSIYGASEGLFAACDELGSAKQLMLVDSCYYEFIPIDDEQKILSLNELEVDKEYEIVITNQSGLYRYRCGDVIRCVGYMNECPYIHFSYRKGQLLNLTGEKTTEEHMAAVVKEIVKKSGCKVTDWTVYTNYVAHPYNYVLILENEKGTDLSGYAEFANEALKEINPRYNVFHEAKELGDIVIENQRPGTHAKWREIQQSKGTPVSTYKPVRILDTDAKEEFFKGNII